MRASPGYGLVASLLVLASVRPGFSSPSSESGSDKSASYLGFVYSNNLPTSPRSDSPPRAVSVVPAEVPPDAMEKAPWCSPGHVELVVDATGQVSAVRFRSDTDPGPLSTSIRTALKQWRFEPVLSDGKGVKEAIITLTYFVAEQPDPEKLQSGTAAPPRLVYSVAPNHPGVFLRNAGEAEPIYVGPGVRVVETMPARGVPPQRVAVFSRYNETRNLVSESHFIYPWLQANITTTFDIEADGSTSHIRIVDSPCPLLDPATVTVVRSWRFAQAPGSTSVEARAVTESVFFDAFDGGLPDRFIQPVREDRKRPKWKTPPRFSRFTLPVYPTLLARDGKRGEAVARVSLDASGQLTEVRITKAKHAEFGLALREAIFGCTFKPAQDATGPVASVIELVAQFTSPPKIQDMTDPRMPVVWLALESKARTVSDAKLDRPPHMLTGRMPILRTTEGVASASPSGTLEFVIDPTGRVKEPIVIQATAPEAGYAAVQAAASWLFEPPTAEGKPVAARVQVEFGSPDQVTTSP